MVGAGGVYPSCPRGMGERCKLPHWDVGRSPRSFATLLYSNHEMRKIKAVFTGWVLCCLIIIKRTCLRY